MKCQYSGCNNEATHRMMVKFGDGHTAQLMIACESHVPAIIAGWEAAGTNG